MKKLIAASPIQYMGRTYEPGDPLPAHDGKMVGAWLNAGTAKWRDTDAEAAAVRSVVQTADKEQKVALQAAAALREMGVAVTNENGDFVGAERLTEQVAALGRKSAQGGAENQEGQEPVGAENNGQSGAQEGAEPEMVTGNLDPEQLARMKKADLEDLAAKLGVDISTAKNNNERAALIAAVEVQTPANEDQDGGAQ